MANELLNALKEAEPRLAEAMRGFSIEEAIDFGRLVTALEFRRHHRLREKDLESRLAAVSREPSRYGPEDWYTSCLAEAQSAAGTARTFKAGAERFFKKTRYELLESHPRLQPVVALLEEAYVGRLAQRCP